MGSMFHKNCTSDLLFFQKGRNFDKKNEKNSVKFVRMFL